MTDAGARPVELELDRQRHLRIRWSDGVESLIPLTVLRRACPCASCRHEREEALCNPLRVMQPAGDARLQATAASAALVGQYALRIEWQDGHNTGIYDYALLRRLGEEAGRP